MPDNLKFYPEQKSVTINPLDKKGELRYFLEGFSGKISQKEITLKYAFPAKLGTASPALKDKVRNILVNILDISQFSVLSGRNRATIVVPICQLKDTSLLAQEGTIKVPILVKLLKQDEPDQELKCSQEILLITDGQACAYVLVNGKRRRAATVLCVITGNENYRKLQTFGCMNSHE